MVGKNQERRFLLLFILLLVIGSTGLFLLFGKANASPGGASGDVQAADPPVPATAPVLSGGSWVPAEITWTPACETTPCTTLEWYVCDVDNDLGNGCVFFSEGAGSDIPFLPDEHLWTEITITGDVSNCSDPAEVVYP